MIFLYNSYGAIRDSIMIKTTKMQNQFMFCLFSSNQMVFPSVSNEIRIADSGWPTHQIDKKF